MHGATIKIICVQR